MTKITGIYAISFDKGNITFIYIGSSNNIGKRWSFHLAKLRSNSHSYNQIQDAWNENESIVKFQIIQECLSDISEEELTQLEQDCVNFFKLNDNVVVINKVQDRIIRTKGKVKDTSKMKQAQTGASNGHARLRPEDIIKIKGLLAEGNLTQAQIAEQFGVSPSHISAIKMGRKWFCL